MIQALIKVPVGEKWSYGNGYQDSTLSESALRKVQAVRAEYPGMDDLLFGTRVFKGYKIMNYNADCSLETLRKMISINRLDWTVLSARENDIPVIGYAEVDVLPFMKDILKRNENGKVIATTRPKKVGQFGGIQGVPLPPSETELKIYNERIL